MKQQFYQTKKANNFNKRHHRQFLAESAPPYLLTDPHSSSLDDFLMRFPIATLNEYGRRVISGKRIC
jgi:hypothetical protein